MKIRIKIVAMFSLFFACSYGNAVPNDTDRIIVKDEGISRPILVLVDIPSAGLLKKEGGRVFLLQGDSGKYIEIDQSTVINFGSILQLKKGASVNISFDDGSYFSLGPMREDKCYKFQELK